MNRSAQSLLTRGENKSASSPVIRKISTSSIRREPCFQPRSAVSPEAVLTYRELLQAGSEPPPIEVIAANADEFTLIHGEHRLESQRLEGRTEVLAIVTECTREEAIVRASIANGMNDRLGVPLSTQEKRVACERVLQLIKALPYDHPFRQGRHGEHGAIAPISEAIGLAQETVRQIRRQVAIEPEIREFLQRHNTQPETHRLYLSNIEAHPVAGKIANLKLIEAHEGYPCKFIGATRHGIAIEFRQPKIASFCVFPHNLGHKEASSLSEPPKSFASLLAESDQRARDLGMPTSRSQVLPSFETRDAMPPEEEDQAPVFMDVRQDLSPIVGQLVANQVAKAKAKAKERVANDFYPTPTELTTGLIDKLFPQITLGKHWLECSDGHGAISSVLKVEKPFLKIKTNDLFPPDGRTPDFQLDATDPQSWEQFGRTDWVITNPPFKVTEQILPLAWENAKRGVIMLLRLSYLEPCGGREQWLRENSDHLRQLIVVNPRPQYRVDTDGTDSVTSAWFVFDRSWSWTRLGVACPFQYLTGWKA
jgi:hypothetical protein